MTENRRRQETEHDEPEKEDTMQQEIQDNIKRQRETDEKTTDTDGETDKRKRFVGGRETEYNENEK